MSCIKVKGTKQRSFDSLQLYFKAFVFTFQIGRLLLWLYSWAVLPSFSLHSWWVWFRSAWDREGASTDLLLSCFLQQVNRFITFKPALKIHEPVYHSPFSCISMCLLLTKKFERHLLYFKVNWLKDYHIISFQHVKHFTEQWQLLNVLLKRE